MKNNIQFLTSDLLSQAGIRHGWFMRYGGVSKDLYDSLNGKKGIGDPAVNVIENRSQALKALSGSSTKSLAHLVHKFQSNIVEVDLPGEFEGYDASITFKKNIMLSQTTADCGSVIISNISGNVVSLVHGSWHTLKAKIICDVVAKIKLYTSEGLVAGIGPMICRHCYEYGLEAVDLFESKYLTKITNKYLVDLKQMIIDQLHESGITSIDDLNICTYENDDFFSHRSNGAKSGRYLTLAGVTDVV